MRLYTWQSPDFDIVRDVSDVEKHCDEMLKDSYQWLFKMLGTNEVIWCWSREENHHPVHALEQVQWTLDVPDEEIVAIINSDVWDMVICEYDYIPAQFSWWYDLSDDEWDRRQEEWRKLNPMRGWDNIFNLQTEKQYEMAQFLIPSPVKEEWVVSTSHHSGWQIDDIFSGICRRVFDTKETAEKFRQSILTAIGDLPHEEGEIEKREYGWYWYCKWDEEELLEKFNLTEDDNGDIIPKKGKE